MASTSEYIRESFSQLQDARDGLHVDLMSREALSRCVFGVIILPLHSRIASFLPPAAARRCPRVSADISASDFHRRFVVPSLFARPPAARVP